MIPKPVVVTKSHGDAEVPFKENDSDVGWQLTLIRRCDNRVEDVERDVNTFTTGLKISPPKNYHLEVIEHPNLRGTGYTMIGVPLIINPDCQEELVISLFKFKEGEDLPLPFIAASLVLRQTEYASITLEQPKARVRIHRDETDDDIEYVPKSSKRNASSSSSSRNGRRAEKGNHFA